ncbi:2-amino-4-hydroxy-6-hydroxymethyldihydropteridine diphosphokinase [Galbibacter sp.]|uniref:2-amino-4-hydroxy-6- hydroxymethyldihydropteridine diphosphokinase n=1 Tax=Galbibacter sp. TaxID=2918471 RepID=UPI003A8E7237
MTPLLFLCKVKNSVNRAYLSAGSNLGDRRANLQKAIELLNEKGGTVTSCSSIYETPAWGFKSDDFYNICLGIDTHLSPSELLDCMLSIETTLGRTRDPKAENYAARTIDLDILFYQDLIIKNEHLVIPHPHMQLRRFVLEPLAEIVPGKIHPVLNQTISELLEECDDQSALVKTDLQIQFQKNNFSRFRFIAIEGNIGAGKTTLATKIAEDFNGQLILERFADNPFLPKFYEDQSRYAFTLEMSFLADRYQQFTSDTSKPNLFNNFMISDYDIFKSLIFANVTLQKEEFDLYRKLFNIMYKEVIKPDIYVFLFQSHERLLENIKKRGRHYEQQIDPDYLKSINSAYLQFIKSHPEINPIIIDVTELDFVKSEKDYKFIIDKIHQGS